MKKICNLNKKRLTLWEGGWSLITHGFASFCLTLSCLIVGGSNEMHQGGNYQDFLKCGELVLDHFFIIIK